MIYGINDLRSIQKIQIYHKTPPSSFGNQSCQRSASQDNIKKCCLDGRRKFPQEISQKRQKAGPQAKEEIDLQYSLNTDIIVLGNIERCVYG